MYQFSDATFYIGALISLVGYFECLGMAERLKVMGLLKVKLHIVAPFLAYIFRVLQNIKYIENILPLSVENETLSH